MGSLGHGVVTIANPSGRPLRIRGVPHALVSLAATSAGLCLVGTAAFFQLMPSRVATAAGVSAPQPARSRAFAEASGGGGAGLVSRELDVQRLRHPTVQLREVRNLFSFRAQPPGLGRSPTATVTRPVPVLGPTVPVTPPAVLPALIGVAERRVDGMPSRTAIFAVGDDPVLAQRGDTVLGRFALQSIAADAVELLDLTTRLTHVVALR